MEVGEWFNSGKGFCGIYAFFKSDIYISFDGGFHNFFSWVAKLQGCNTVPCILSLSRHKWVCLWKLPETVFLLNSTMSFIRILILK